MTVAIAQGTFDLLHTGHLHYLREAATHGDELVVIVARRANVTHKPAPILPARQRREIVGGLAVVDRAILGNEEDIFIPIERIDPEVVVLGHDQHHEETAIREGLDDRGVSARIVRASSRKQQYEGEVLSTSDIIERVLAERA